MYWSSTGIVILNLGGGGDGDGDGTVVVILLLYDTPLSCPRLRALNFPDQFDLQGGISLQEGNMHIFEYWY